MKLIRYGTSGFERPGIIDSCGQPRSLSNIVDDIQGDTLGPESLTRLRELDTDELPTVEVNERLGPPLARIGKIVCAGLNYRDHAQETGLALPTEPLIFLKSPTAISGPNDAIIQPPKAKQLDWEVELGVVIGSKTRYIDAVDVERHIAGYVVANDITERSYQFERGGQWTKGKSADTFCPLGPWLVTADEISNPQSLSLWLEVNGMQRQQSTTANMNFSVGFLVSYISHFMTLLPGDLILTGTPAGVGYGKTPLMYLQVNDTIKCGITGLGCQSYAVTPHVPEALY